MALDPTNTDVAYVLGRLFSLLEELQLRAAGKGNEPNATIRDRYFGAASSTPAIVFPQVAQSQCASCILRNWRKMAMVGSRGRKAKCFNSCQHKHFRES